MFGLIIMIKPAFLYNKDGSVREFGIGYRNKTILPIWLLSLILGIVSYLMCLSAIYWAKIKNVYYANTKTDAKNIGFDDQEIYEELNKSIDERKISIKKIASNNSLDSFELWNEKKDKLEY
jgi:lipopolysaccharide export LptBFGC system permease protein LptF